jgi:hypothetical protein
LNTCSVSEDLDHLIHFAAPAGEYLIQVRYDEPPVNERWGNFERTVEDTDEQHFWLLRAAPYHTSVNIESPRGTDRFTPSESGDFEISIYNGEESGSKDVTTEVYVYPEGDSRPSEPTETLSTVSIDADRQETVEGTIPIPDSEGTYTVDVEVETDFGSQELTSDYVDVGTVTVDSFEPPEIDSNSPSDPAVDVYSDEPTEFSVSTSDPDTDTSSLTHTWYVDGQEVATGSSFMLNPSEYSEGEHSVEVVVSDGTTETADVSQSWTIDIAYEPPEIDSSDPSDSGVEGFDDDSTTFSVSASDTDSTSLSYIWYVDDQEVASGTSYIFNPSNYSGGEHDVEVVVSDGSTETQDTSTSWTIEVIEAPEIGTIDPGSSEADIGSSVTFSADATDPGGHTPLSYEWTIDGQTYDGAEVSQTFTSEGEVSAEVAVTNSQDVSTTQSFTVDIEAVQPQIDDITGGGSEITAGESVSLSATASDPADRDVDMSYSWDILGDTYDGSSVSVSPTEVGQHDVELTATNEYGTATTQTTTITVNNDVPELTAANDSDRSLTAGQSGSFTVSLADSDASDTDLEFIVDGETVEERQVSQSEADETFSYQFSTPGEHSVELTAADGHGASTTIGWTVDAASRPPEFETWAPEDSNLYALTGTTFEFNATASDPDGQTVSYQWYVDDNYTASGESLTHQFNQNGEYTVQVVATDPDNTTTERSWDVVISSFNEQPIIDNQVSAVTIDENSSTEFATVSLSNPAVNNRTAEVEIIVQPPDGLSVTSATNVQSGSPAQYQVSESAQPGSSMSLTLGLQLDDEALLGRPVAVDYSIIYYPEGQRADSVVLENSTQEIVIGNQATSTRDQLTVGESGDGFTAVTTVVGAGLFAALYLRRRT